YDQFQISDGVAGNAEAEANAVFVDPFPSDLSTVDATSLANLNTMREAAESAETDLFNPQIAAASGDAAAALQVGKIKNKVLKLTGEVQGIKIKIAQATAAGEDTTSLESDLAEEQTKLSNNIATDVKSAGDPSQGVAGSSSAAAVDVAVSASSTSAAKTKATKTAITAAAAATTVAAAASGTFSFALQDYSAFQISDGVAGNAEAEANAVFVDPFPSDLSTVDATSLANLNTMREAAESAETDLFNPQIAAASGDAAAALQVGKIKNKVLKLTGEVQGIKIKIAQATAAGEDTTSLESDLAEEQTKLSNNIATDVKSAGDASQGVA
ncbi:hypothetical protein FB451DRAFT_1030195, partial [Mycena latifolia]